MFNTVLIFFILSAATLLFSVVAALMLLRHERRVGIKAVYGEQSEQEKIRKDSILTPFQIFIVGFFLATVLMFFPALYYTEGVAESHIFIRELKSFFLSVNVSLKTFLLDSDFDAISAPFMDADSEALISSWLFNAYTAYASVLHVVAPMLTAGFVLSFFKETRAALRIIFHRRSRTFIMSELNERSLALAIDVIKTEHERKLKIREEARGKPIKWLLNHLSAERTLIIFADVFENDDEKSYELISKAKKIGAICIKRDISEINLKYMRRDNGVKVYFIGENENENLDQALKMIKQCTCIKELNNEGSQFYVFARSGESEVILDSLFAKHDALPISPKPRKLKKRADKSKTAEDVDEIRLSHPKVRRVNESRNLIYDTMLKDPIFNHSVEQNGINVMNIAIVGLGSYGTELLKTLCWLGQAKNHKINVHVFDIEDAEQRMKFIAPELIEYNDKIKKNGPIWGEADYTLSFYGNMDVSSADFLRKIAKIDTLTGVYVTLGEDDINIKTAMRIRSELKKETDEQIPIYAVVYDSLKTHMLTRNGGLQSSDSAKYGITFIGSLESNYSIERIEQKELEARALECHEKWATTGEEHASEKLKFEKYEYFRKSSKAEAVYYRISLNCKILSEDGEERAVYEHCRWNAYMRSEGYRYGKSKDHVAKTHPLLREYDTLSEADKFKDNIIRNGILVKKDT